jgi:hypothetical protein
MRVDFPAPFSPTSASTSPVEIDKFTESLATTPGNLFVIPRNSSFIFGDTSLRTSEKRLVGSIHLQKFAHKNKGPTASAVGPEF